METSHLDLPIVEEATVSSEQAEPSERPNKYGYPEFAGLAGERYLLSLAEQFAPLALWRTWYAAVSFQAPGQPCYVGVSRLAERIGPQERKVYLDLKALEARGWLMQERVRLPFVAKDGSAITHLVTVKDFSGFYQTAHDYHEWLHSPDYIPPERANIPLILADPALARRLIRFENYRRLLLCGKPGRKRETGDYYCCQLAHLEQELADGDPPKVNQYSNGHAKTDSAYRKEETENLPIGGDSSILSTSENESLVAAMTIRNTHRELPSSNPKPKPPSTPQAGGAARRAEATLGYTEGELKHDTQKRGAAAVGIPAEQYRKLTGGQDQEEQREAGAQREPERPARDVPAQVLEEMKTYASLYDDAHLVGSDLTRISKIYATAEQTGSCFQQTHFWQCYDQARKAAGKYARKRFNSKGRVNRVPYFFTCLENALGFSLEELIFLRTEDPLYTDYSLSDVVGCLRQEHRQQCAHRQTVLDYRAWLVSILDELEHRKEPKQRLNPTTRD